MKVLIIDNYDSFTYNLVHLVQSLLQQDIDVVRNDKLNIEKVAAYDKIMLSPGPGIPNEAGMLKQVIKKYAPIKSILGVCLGLQAITEVFGGQLKNLDEVFHGISTEILITAKDSLFVNIPERFFAGRYHSWIAAKDNFPECLKVTAEDEQGNIMALSHKSYDVKGVQFHPESVLTEVGAQIIKNWLFDTQKAEVKFPSLGNKSFDISALSSKLLFC
ncbi:MAG: aminodeoxychorismate/anthranilate synthase component II [Bacteroidota bacterium]|nr:aminodeoxychorismate/anthranilate synthase component II [Bacteroidota bacterium]